MIQSEIISQPEEIRKFEPQWRQMFHSGKYQPSASFEWTWALISTHIGKNDSFQLVVMKDGDDVVGLIPLIRREIKRYGLSIVNLFPISEIYNTHSDLIIKNSSLVIERLLNILFSIKRWDVFRMGYFLENSSQLAAFESCLNGSSFQYDIQDVEPAFFIEFKGGYSDYLMERSGKFRNYLNRMDRKINQMGDVRFEKVKNETSLKKVYDHLLHIEERSWKNDHGTSINRVKKQEKFYKLLCENTSENGWLHLVFLYLNNEPIAYNMGLVANDIYYYLKTSYVNEYRKVSPSTVLRARLIEDLIAQGVRFFDFPGEPYEWEKQWADSLRWHKGMILYNRSFKAKALSKYQRVKKARERNRKTSDVVYHDPRRLKL